MLHRDRETQGVEQSVRIRPDTTTCRVLMIDGAVFAWRIKLLPLMRHDAREATTLMAGT